LVYGNIKEVFKIFITGKIKIYILALGYLLVIDKVCFVFRKALKSVLRVSVCWDSTLR
jgi:hypothetical protein